MQAPLQAALPLHTTRCAARSDSGGAVAFADACRLRTILADAGFDYVSIKPFDADIGGADVEQTLNLALRVGPLGAALREHPELTDNVSDAVRDVLSKYVTPNGVVMPAAVWIVLAQNE